MIFTMNFSGLANAELLSFGQSLDEVLAPVGETIVLIYTPFKQALTVCEQTSIDAVAKQVAQQQTQLLLDTDTKRDNLFRGLKLMVQAYSLHSDPVKHTAAVELGKAICKIGWHLHRESYDQQSALLRTLFADLENDCAAYVAELGIASYVDSLKNEQTEFDALRQEQLDQQTEFSEVSSMSAVRDDLEHACKDLLEILPGYYRMTGDEALRAVLPKISELIDRTR